MTSSSIYGVLVFIGLAAYYFVTRRMQSDPKCKPPTVSTAPLGLVPGPANIPGLTWRPYSHTILGPIFVPAAWAHEEVDGADYFCDEATESYLRFQHQTDVHPYEIVGYTESFISNNVRDAPGYETRGAEYGSLGRSPAARVEGRFDNGTAFCTRDYVVLVGGAAVMITARARYIRREQLAQIIDTVIGHIREHGAALGAVGEHLLNGGLAGTYRGQCRTCHGAPEQAPEFTPRERLGFLNGDLV